MRTISQENALRGLKFLVWVVIVAGAVLYLYDTFFGKGF